MRLSREDAFAILEIEETEDTDEIRKAFKRLALKHHPDKNQNTVQSTDKFKEINAAYARLTSTDSDDDLDDLDPSDIFTDELFAYMGVDPFLFFLQELFGGGRMPRGRGRRGAGRGRGGFVFSFGSRGGGRPRRRGGEDEDDDDEWVTDDSDGTDYEDGDSDDGEHVGPGGVPLGGFGPDYESDKYVRRQAQKEDKKYARQKKAAEMEEFFSRPTTREETRVQDAIRKFVQRQLPRPVMVSRTHNSITVSVDRKGVGDEPYLEGHLVYELQYKPTGGATWATATHTDGTTQFECDGLESGTKYQFRGRGGVDLGPHVEWGGYSVESAYATAGRAPAVSVPATPPAVPEAEAAAARKARRKERRAARPEPAHTAGAPPVEESDQLAEQQQQREQQRRTAEREAAVQAAMAAAAADYEKEAAKQAAKAAAEAARNNANKAPPKSKKKKGKKGPELAPTAKPAAATALQQPSASSTPSAATGPRTPVATAAPPPAVNLQNFTTRASTTVARGNMSNAEWRARQRELEEQEANELEWALRESMQYAPPAAHIHVSHNGLHNGGSHAHDTEDEELQQALALSAQQAAAAAAAAHDMSDDGWGPSPRQQNGWPEVNGDDDGGWPTAAVGADGWPVEETAPVAADDGWGNAPVNAPANGTSHDSWAHQQGPPEAEGFWAGTQAAVPSATAAIANDAYAAWHPQSASASSWTAPGSPATAASGWGEEYAQRTGGSSSLQAKSALDISAGQQLAAVAAAAAAYFPSMSGGPPATPHQLQSVYGNATSDASYQTPHSMPGYGQHYPTTSAALYDYQGVGAGLHASQPHPPPQRMPAVHAVPPYRPPTVSTAYAPAAGHIAGGTSHLSYERAGGYPPMREEYPPAPTQSQQQQPAVQQYDMGSFKLYSSGQQPQQPQQPQMNYASSPWAAY